MLKYLSHTIAASVLAVALLGCGGEGRSGSTAVRPPTPSTESAAPPPSSGASSASSPVAPPTPPPNPGDRKGGPGSAAAAQQLVSDYERDPPAAYKTYQSGSGVQKIVVEGEVKELQEWAFGATRGVTVVFATTGRLSLHARMGRHEKVELKPGDKVQVEGVMQGTSPWKGDENKILLADGKVLKGK